MNQLFQLKSRILVFVAALTCFALSSGSKAVTPPPDGGYPGGNTAEGTDALLSLSSGTDNTAIGADALANNVSGSDNTAVGFQALLLATGNHTTAVGSEALFFDTSGHDNTATGFQALLNNTSGIENAASGAFALINNQTGDFNTATGTGALQANIGGDANTATGTAALSDNTSGINNTANGVNALFFNTTGHDNTADGLNALLNNRGSNNIAVGSQAGSNLTSGSNNIDIGNLAVAGESGKIRIGKQGTQNATFIAGIYNMHEGGTIKPVFINSNGRLGTQPPASARKFKEEIKAMEKSSEGMLKLKPVTFRYKNDAEHTPQFGLIAEEVANVNPDLVVRDEHGEVYTVRYEAVNAMLLNEFLKARRQIDAQQKQIEALTAGLQKVSAQLELNKSRPQTVQNSQ